jgi:hypothetical protein
MADVVDTSESEPKLVSFAALKNISRQLPRYRHGLSSATTGPATAGGMVAGNAGGGTGTIGRADKKLSRNTAGGALVTLDMVNGKLVSNVHGISLIQVCSTSCAAAQAFGCIETCLFYVHFLSHYAHAILRTWTKVAYASRTRPFYSLIFESNCCVRRISERKTGVFSAILLTVDNNVQNASVILPESMVKSQYLELAFCIL